MHFIIEREDLDRLLSALQEHGRIIGPTILENTFGHREIASSQDFPAGWTFEQEGGFFRLRPGRDRSLFGYTVGQDSWKKDLYPPRSRLLSLKKTKSSFSVTPEKPSAEKVVFFGVRPCDLAAIDIQDTILTKGPFADPEYSRRRKEAMIVAMECTRPAATCFCASMGTGPGVFSGYDLALTEVVDGGLHYFLVRAGTEQGRSLIAGLGLAEAQKPSINRGENLVREAASSMGRTMDQRGIKQLLYDNHEHPRWDQVARRCLTCGNCTQVCPTCFCHTVYDRVSLSGNEAQRFRCWDSCFLLEHSYIHGGSVRVSARSRYRQWITHKLASWIDQFAVSGCVGCGRCITWCPVGIDITEEIRAIRQS
ncbi:MAG: 4Fe-4S dicluster domain-containing protein [Desulfohalobiaceae bacterium]|nr:4Fe-4S dicluster domain-containing protein [Desulfohalobiaceae bacterium]